MIYFESNFIVLLTPFGGAGGRTHAKINATFHPGSEQLTTLGTIVTKRYDVSLQQTHSDGTCTTQLSKKLHQGDQTRLQQWHLYNRV